MIAWDAIQQQLLGATAIPANIAEDKGWIVDPEQVRHTTCSAYASAAKAYSHANINDWEQQDAIQDACLLILRYGLGALQSSPTPEDLAKRWHVLFRDRAKSAIKSLVLHRLPVIAPESDIDPLAVVPWAGLSPIESEALETKAEDCLWRALGAMDDDSKQLVLMLRGGKTTADFMKWRIEQGRPCTKQAVSLRLLKAREIIKDTWDEL